MKEPFAAYEPKIAVIGGGTGSFTLLRSLKKHSSQIAAIVNMADDGGSTGVLRDELGSLPPGDVRQCLVALSDSPKVRDLFDYRFEKGGLKGHSMGNILLSALEKMSGSFVEAVDIAGEILHINGLVVPATTDNVRLKMEWPGKSLILKGERVIDAEYFKYDPRQAKLSLTPNAKANPMALRAIEMADVVVIAPGDLYTSIGPLLVIDGIGEALMKTKAKVVYVCNLVTKHGQTDNFTVSDHASEIERFGGGKFIDYVFYNQQKPRGDVLKRYTDEKAYITSIDKNKLSKAHYLAIPGNYIGEVAKFNKHDTLKRSLIRHDADAVANTLIDLINS